MTCPVCYSTNIRRTRFTQCLHGTDIQRTRYFCLQCETEFNSDISYIEDVAKYGQYQPTMPSWEKVFPPGGKSN